MLHRSLRVLACCPELLGVTLRTSSVFGEVGAAGGAGVRQAALGAYLGLSSENVSNAVQRLVLAGLIERREDAGDRRHTWLVVTRRGAAVWGLAVGA